MKFNYKPSPNYHDKPSTQGIMKDVMIALLAVALFAIGYYYVSYGTDYAIRVVAMLVVSVGVSILTEVLWCLLMKKNIKEFLSASFPIITGLILALMCPVSISFYALGVAAVFAILFGKLLFGGFGHNIFNPAAVGRAVIFASFATAKATDFLTSATPTATMDGLGWLITDSSIGNTFLAQFGGLSSLFLGTYPGAIGETSSLVLLLAAGYLIYKKAIDWYVPATYLGSLFAMACVVMVLKQTVVWYPLFHVLTGGAMFGAIFMMTDPVTSPTSKTGKIIFALGCAIITMLIRLKANLPEGVLYSILLMNMLTPMIESLTDGQQIKKQKRNIATISALGTIGLVLVIVVSIIIKPIVPTPPVVEPTGPELKPISLQDEDLDAFKGVILSSEVVGDTTTYVVEIPGYGLLYSTDDYYTYTKNKFEIVVNTTENTLISVKFLAFGDTPGIGDDAANEDYLNTFNGMDMTNKDAEVDVVSGATFSSMSLVSAVRLVMDELGK